MKSERFPIVLDLSRKRKDLLFGERIVEQDIEGLHVYCPSDDNVDESVYCD